MAAVDTSERLEAGGVVAALETAALSSRMVATIADVRVKAGDRVRAGDVLVTLDARDVTEHTGQARAGAVAAEKALAQARTEQTTAEAEHRLAVAWQKRIATLHARNSATDQERDEAEARLAAAAARVSGAQAGIEQRAALPVLAAVAGAVLQVVNEDQAGQVGHPIGTGLLPLHPVDVQQIAHGIEAQGGHVAVAVAQQRIPEGAQRRAAQRLRGVGRLRRRGLDHL